MYGKLVYEIPPREGNPRNSEGAFIRLEDGAILMAYSHYSGSSFDDDANCDIYGIISRDNGLTWGEEHVIATGSMFGVINIMSVSALEMPDGRRALIFIVKELEDDSNFGVAFTRDGKNYEVRRIAANYNNGYYVLNNDRVERLSDGRIILPVAQHLLGTDGTGRITHFDERGTGYFFEADSELNSLHALGARMELGSLTRSGSGIQEVGLIEKENGVLWAYARTDRGYQAECFSFDGLANVTPVQQSWFTSPCSPMKIKRNPYTGELFSVWNPTPNYNGRKCSPIGDRTPLALARSTDDGISWHDMVLLEDEYDRGYCYPSLFFADEHTLLIEYCRGGIGDRCCINRLGIQRVEI